MNEIKLSSLEYDILSKAKKELLTDVNATFRSNALNYKLFIDIAKKHNYPIQVLFDAIGY